MGKTTEEKILEVRKTLVQNILQECQDQGLSIKQVDTIISWQLREDLKHEIRKARDEYETNTLFRYPC